MQHRYGRRAVLGGMAATAVAGVLGSGRAALAQGQPPINVVINQSPWLKGFAGIVDLYQKQTGNTVNLDVNPYAGSLEKQRNAVRSERSEFDLLIINGIFYPEMYYGGFLEPLKNIDPKFDLDPQIYTYDDTPWFDSRTRTVNRQTGDLLTVPVNPNISLLFYRADLYAEKGLKVPETWDDLLANAKALHNPPKMMGIVQRAARAAIAVSWDYWPYLYSHGGSLFRNEKTGDFLVTLNSPEAREALETYLRLGKEAGPANMASLDQNDLIQYMVTGRAAHAVLTVAAQSQMDDPNNSAVVGKVGYANLPHKPGFASAPALGHWLGGIPKNIADENKRAALAFLDWFQQPTNQIAYAEMGGAPVSKAAYESDFANRPENRYMKTMVVASPMARQMTSVPQGAAIISVLELGLNQAVAGEITVPQALNSMAGDIEKIMADAGYKTGRLPDLPA